MKKSKRILSVLFLAALLISTLCVPAFALTESEVQAQVAATSREAVTGNVLIWFLCAVAFLKVSQKIDSIMASLGVNVGRTGGSMLAEAMIAMRAVTMVVSGGRGGGAGRAGSASGSASGSSGGAGMAGFFKGGLIGMAGRHITNSAVKTATTQTSAVHTAQSQAYQAASSPAAAAAGDASEANINNEVHSGGSSVHTDNSFAVGAPLQDGVIADGGGVSAPAASTESVPSAGSMPDGMPPQEGVILTGSEPPPSIPADPLPQMESAPPDGVPLESMPAGMTPPEGGVVITGGDTVVNAVQTDNIVQGSPVSSAPQGNTVTTGGQHTETHTDRTAQTVSHSSASSERVQNSHSHVFSTGRPTLGGMVFSHSLASGGSFANDVIGTVARGEVAGSITGDMAAQSLQSYLGYTAQGSPPPVFTEAEIGRGRITGQVATPEHPQPIAFSLYHTEQYMEPKGDFTKIRSADGTLWYSQMAQDTVEHKPYTAPDGTVAYKERIVKKLPDPPKRKDRI